MISLQWIIWAGTESRYDVELVENRMIHRQRDFDVILTSFYKLKVDSALAQKEVDIDDVDFTCNFNVGSMLKYSC